MVKYEVMILGKSRPCINISTIHSYKVEPLDWKVELPNVDADFSLDDWLEIHRDGTLYTKGRIKRIQETDENTLLLSGYDQMHSLNPLKAANRLEANIAAGTQVSNQLSGTDLSSGTIEAGSTISMEYGSDDESRFNRIKALKELVFVTGYELYRSPAGAVDFKSACGTDKSSTIIFRRGKGGLLNRWVEPHTTSLAHKVVRIVVIGLGQGDYMTYGIKGGAIGTAEKVVNRKSLVTDATCNLAAQALLDDFENNVEYGKIEVTDTFEGLAYDTYDTIKVIDTDKAVNRNYRIMEIEKKWNIDAGETTEIKICNLIHITSNAEFLVEAGEGFINDIKGRGLEYGQTEQGAKLPFDYEFYKASSLFKARKQETGKILTENADAHEVFQAIVTDASSGNVIYIRHGTYPDLHVVITDKKIGLLGDGIGATILKPKTGYFAITYTSAGANLDYAGSVKNLSIDDAATANGSGIHLNKVSYVATEDVFIHVTKDAFKITKGYHNQYTRCVGWGENGCAFLIEPPSGEVVADTIFDDCHGKNSQYGFKFLEGANGVQLKGACLATGNAIAGFYSEGAWSGGWYDEAIADINDGDGFVFKDTANKPCESIQMVNCWSRSNNRGIVIEGTTGSQGVIDLQMTNCIFSDNAKTGMKIIGFVAYLKIDGKIKNNSTDNLTDDEATNLLIMDDPQLIDLSDCFIGWTVSSPPSNRKSAARVIMTTAATRDTIVKFKDCTLFDAADSSKAVIGLKNTHASYELKCSIAENEAINRELDELILIESGSTGTIRVVELPEGITTKTMPIENLVLNAGFERDVDANGIPDDWDLYEATGSGSITHINTDQRLGKYCIKVTSDTTTSQIAGLSNFIPINIEKTYYWETWLKTQRLNNADITIIIYGYDKDKNYVGTLNPYSNQNGNQAWTKYAGTAKPSDIGATVRYIRIGLYCTTPTIASAYILYDGVIFSVQRATIPTTGVLYSFGLGSGSVDVPNNTWTAFGGDWVTNEPTELVIAMLSLSCDAAFADGNEIRVRAGVGSIHYPTDSGQVIWIKGAPARIDLLFVIPFPRDIAGENVHFDIYQNSGASRTFKCARTITAIRIHSHR